MATIIPALSQTDLLKMPDNAYMNDQQLAFFHAQLANLRQEITAEIEEAKQCIADYHTSPDPLDTASDQEMLQTALRVVERRSELLRKVITSLKRIEAGDYGYCELSDEPIGLNRLLARPTATLSVAAKERQEFLERTEGRIVNG